MITTSFSGKKLFIPSIRQQTGKQIIKMNSILYIGGFEMPDNNAAAQRVLSIAKALRLSGYSISFYGITKRGDINGIVDGFQYEAIPYPRGTKEWVSYAIGDGITDYICEKRPDIVIAYNYPFIAQERIIRYCRKNRIKVVGDITEWYMPSGIIRKLDTAFRMRWSNKHLDGIIAISKLLKEYYFGCNTVQIPPIIDTNDRKWKQPLVNHNNDRIKLIYAGVPGVAKDRLDYIVKAIANVPHDNMVFNIVGITNEQYYELYGYDLDLSKLPIVFHGRLSHNDTLQLLKASDFQIFIRPNLRVNNAGFPTKFVESMTAGIPVIMNRISNVEDYLKDGYNGFLIAQPIESEIQEALEKVLKLGRIAIDQMKSNCDREVFDYHRYSRALETFIDGIVNDVN